MLLGEETHEGVARRAAHRPGERLGGTAEQGEQGRLARAVGADDPDHVARGDGEVEAFEEHAVTMPTGQVLRDERGRHESEPIGAPCSGFTPAGRTGCSATIGGTGQHGLRDHPGGRRHVARRRRRHPHHAARRAARATRRHLAEEGVRPRPVRLAARCCSTGAATSPAWRSRSPTTAREVVTAAGLGAATGCTRCSRPSSSTTATSAATARRARSARAVGMLDEAEQGHPSHVTEDLDGRRRPRRRRDPRADERQPVPLRCLPRHPGRGPRGGAG